MSEDQLLDAVRQCWASAFSELVRSYGTRPANEGPWLAVLIQMPAMVEAAVLEARRTHPSWGPWRIASEIIKRSPGLDVSESAVYRCLRRAGLIEPDTRRRRRKDWKRWERGEPNELWQMDVVGGFLIADNSRAKALTGIDDHSRMCVSAKLMAAERTRLVCAGLSATLQIYGVPEQILTDIQAWWCP